MVTVLDSKWLSGPYITSNRRFNICVISLEGKGMGEKRNKYCKCRYTEELRVAGRF